MRKGFKWSDEHRQKMHLLYKGINTFIPKTKEEEATYHRKYHQLKMQDPEYRKKDSENVKRWYRSPRGKWQTLNDQCKVRKCTNTLTYEQYEKLISQGCHYCKRDLTEVQGYSLDRIVNSNRNYTITNVLPCCGECNEIRGSLLTVEEAEVMIEVLLNYRKTNSE